MTHFMTPLQTSTTRLQRPDLWDWTLRRSSILGQRRANPFWRVADTFERNNRTDHVRHTPGKLACYLQVINAELFPLAK